MHTGDAKEGQTVVVDVREQLRAGREPFLDIMAAAEKCRVGDTLVLYATFKPVPLLAVMKTQGFEGTASPIEDGDWRVDFLRVAEPGGSDGDGEGPASAGPPDASAGTPGQGAAPEPEVIHLDNRGLEPPQPLVRTVEALYALKPGQRVIGKYDRKPMFLLPKLDDMGYKYETEVFENGQAQVTIWSGGGAED